MKDKLFDLMQLVFIGFVVVFGIIFWHWEDIKYEAIYTCEDQQKAPFSWAMKVEAPEWCER
jgi:hypothetical protein